MSARTCARGLGAALRFVLAAGCASEGTQLGPARGGGTNPAPDGADGAPASPPPTRDASTRDASSGEDDGGAPDQASPRDAASGGAACPRVDGLVTDAFAVFVVPETAKPGYRSPVREPTFATEITRISGDATTAFPVSYGGSGGWGSGGVATGSWGLDARHHYTDDQPWNADSSLIALQNSGSPGMVILDGTTYAPRYAPCSAYDFADDRWHPTLPNVRVNLRGSTLEWFDIEHCRQVRAATLPMAAPGDFEGNPSADGRYAAVWDASKLVVVDMGLPASTASPVVGPAFDYSDCGLGDCSIDWAAISPLGKYVVVSHNGDHPRVLDVGSDLSLSPRAIPPSAPQCSGHDPARGFVYDLGHAAMAPNPFDGNEEVLVGQVRSWCPQVVGGAAVGSVVMVRLRDGSVTTLTKPGNEANSYHVSTRNLGRPGYVYVSYWENQTGKRFDEEVIAVKMDGSQTVERFAHMHTDTNGCYRCESHPVPSRDGIRIMFASAWDLNCAAGGPCGSSSNPQSYVVDTCQDPSRAGGP